MADCHSGRRGQERAANRLRPQCGEQRPACQLCRTLPAGAAGRADDGAVHLAVGTTQGRARPEPPVRRLHQAGAGFHRQPAPDAASRGLDLPEDCPGDYETVRQLLAHRQIATTIKFYAAGAETTSALARYDDVLARRRAERRAQAPAKAARAVMRRADEEVS